MRRSYQLQLEDVRVRLEHMSGLAAAAVRDATRAVVTADLAAAEGVIRDDEVLDGCAVELEDQIVELLARQAPVACDLRLLVSALGIARAFERMGDLARHVAEAARRRDPTGAVPAELVPTIERMGELAASLAVRAGRLVRQPDPDLAAQLDRDDDEMDLLHRTLLADIERPTWPHGVQAGVDLALVGRFYERFADQAVGVGRRVVFLSTGPPAPRRAGRQPGHGSRRLDPDATRARHRVSRQGSRTVSIP